MHPVTCAVTIGVTMDYEPPGPANGFNHGRAFYYINWEYVEMLRGLGAKVLCLPPAAGPEAVRDLVDHLDGLMLTGGTDIDPASYGEGILDSRHPVDSERTGFEAELVLMALERGLPVFGICRGAQMINVALGGTLYQDLSTQRPGSVDHRASSGSNGTRHRVRIEPESRLHAILGVTELEVNSYHHQGIRELGRDLVPGAWGPDGLVEAVEIPSQTFCLGVQWHPERDRDNPSQQMLVRAFLEAADRYRRDGRVARGLKWPCAASGA
jgi:putative glutamine amidotransferase